MKNVKKYRITAAVMPVCIIIRVLICRLIILRPGIHPGCVFYTLTGYYCPGCGGTRSFILLSSGHIIKALYYNPIVPFGAVLLAAFYIEILFKAAGKCRKIIPRSCTFWYIFLGIMLAFYFLRNLGTGFN